MTDEVWPRNVEKVSRARPLSLVVGVLTGSLRVEHEDR